MNITCYLDAFPNQSITLTNTRTVIDATGSVTPAGTPHTTTLDNTGHGTVSVPVWASGAALYAVRVAGHYDVGQIAISADGPDDLAALLDLAGIPASVVSLIAARVAALEAAAPYEPALGTPSTSGYVLSSLTDGTREWVAQSGGSVAWDDLTGTPTTLAGYGITDAVSDTDLLNYLLTSDFTWTNLSGTPATFPPSAHQHPLADVTGLQAALDDKADATALATHTTATNNPHSVTAAQTGAYTTGATDSAISSAVGTHAAVTTSVHGIADTASLVLTNDTRLSNNRPPTSHAASHISGSDQLADATTTTHGLMSAPDKTKLDSVASGATANQSDAYLLSRANHTGTQPSSTLSDSTAAGRALLTAADAAAQRASLGLASVPSLSAPQTWTGAQTFTQPITDSAEPAADSSLINRLYILSRLQNLVTNGSGLLGTNYNFPGLTFDATETHSGGGSFAHTRGGSTATESYTSAEYLPVDPEKNYRMVLWAKSGNRNGTQYNAGNRHYIGVAPYDADRNSVAPYHYARYPGATDTTLAAPLNPGDTTITLTSAAGWSTSAAGHTRNIAWYGYANSFGYVYPDYTYTRYSSSNYAGFGGSGAWETTGISGNVITLRAPWPGPALPAGAAVRNTQSGSAYKYCVLSNGTIPNAWTRYEGSIGGYDTAGAILATAFPYGTAYVRLMFLPNYAPTVNNVVRFSDIWFSEFSAVNLEPATTTTPGTLSAADKAKLDATLPSTAAGGYTVSDSGTTTTVPALTLAHSSTGTAAAGFGVRLRAALKSSTTDSRDAAYDDTTWSTATDTSRTAQRSIWLARAGVMTEVARFDNADSSTQTNALLLHNGTLKRVEVGAPDSGGAGYRLLRIAN